MDDSKRTHPINLGKLHLLISHRSPSHPARHWQVNWLIPSTHVPPFKQGEELHSLISKSNWSKRDTHILKNMQGRKEISKLHISKQIIKQPKVNPKRARLFGPISQPGGRIPPPPPDLGNRLTKYQVCGTSG